MVLNALLMFYTTFFREQKFLLTIIDDSEMLDEMEMYLSNLRFITMFQ